MSQAVTRLRIDDEEFLVASLIERCPKVMMLRELVQNAVEAAMAAPDGTGRIDILPIRVAGTQKLAIRNTGPGMSATELFRMCDLAASIGKQKGLDRNFGMGAKVAALPANRLGMRYRSCKAGRVNEVVIGKRDGIYGRVRRNDPLSLKPVDITDETGTALAAGLSVSHDWTEVVLLGDETAQDTTEQPFGGDPAMPPDWLVRQLYHRFYRVPANVGVWLHPGIVRGREPRRFLPIDARTDMFARTEIVALHDGTQIHYLLDLPDAKAEGRNLSASGAATPGDSTAAVIFRNEMYDVRTGWKWSQIAPRFGLAFGVAHVSVHVELAADAPVLPDAYRQFLRHDVGEQAQIEVTDYASLVAANRPAWLIDALRALGPDTRIAASLREELHGLIRSLGLRRRTRAVPALAAPLSTFAAVGENFASSTPVTREPECNATAPDSDLHEMPPEIVLLRDQRHIDDRLLDKRAAGYDEGSHEMFVNMRYPAFAHMTDALLMELQGRAEAETLRAACTEAAEETLIRRIGRTLVHGIAKREHEQGWNSWQLAAATSPEALTLAADDYVWSMPDARAHVANSLEEIKTP